MQEAYAVAKYLKTKYESKKHGGYDIYEDDKIIIYSDTYYPNLDIYIKDVDKKVLVLSRSGHGYSNEYHPGKWEEYIRTVLYPKARIACEKQRVDREQCAMREHEEKFGAINDSHVFK